MRWAWAAALPLLVMSSGTALAVGESVSIAIVDAPRPQTQWGYAPGARTVAPGTWVTWSNDGQDAHTVTAVDGSFDSGDLDPSEGFSWYFDQPGTVEYVCVLHPWMTGRIVVAGEGEQPPSGDEPPDDPNELE
jgi:plastocyanin